jgi:hypothetical protein
MWLQTKGFVQAMKKKQHSENRSYTEELFAWPLRLKGLVQVYTKPHASPSEFS